MDLYKYVNSRDIREYLQSLDYQFNTIEAAWLIYQSGTYTLEEKIDAWYWIIKNMSDCEVIERPNCKYRKSLHETLIDYIQLMKKYTLEFHNNENCVYTYRYYYAGSHNCYIDSYNYVYKSLDECFDSLYYECGEEQNSEYVDLRIVRHSILCDKRNIEAKYNKDKKILCVSADIRTDDEKDLTSKFFDGMWFSFPTPFRRGDILIKYNENEILSDRPEGGILVVEDCAPEWLKGSAPEILQSYIDGHNGDSTDMTVLGYFQEKEGGIYEETTYNYMDYEYYRGVFEGKSVLMKALSCFMQGKIDISILLAAYRKIILDEYANDIIFDSSCLSDF